MIPATSALYSSRLAGSFLLLLLVLGPVVSFSAQSDLFSAGPADSSHPVNALVGERLTYDIGFLWFDRLAQGTISLERGAVPGTYLIRMAANTLGVAAFLTGNRVEHFETLIEIGPDGLLRPLRHDARTRRTKGGEERERIKQYRFDYRQEWIHYQKNKNGRIVADESFRLDPGRPLFDILSALYNLRLGFFGVPGQGRIMIPTFHPEGPEDIVIAPLSLDTPSERSFFSGAAYLCRILVDPEVFGTRGRDILASFDQQWRPYRGVIKNVIGLGDVRGQLTKADRMP